MTEFSDLKNAVHNANREDLATLGVLATLGAVGAIEPMAILHKNYSDSVVAIAAFEQMRFLEGANAGSDDFVNFKAGQASVLKYFAAAFNYTQKPIDKEDEASHNV